MFETMYCGWVGFEEIWKGLKEQIWGLKELEEFIKVWRLLEMFQNVWKCIEAFGKLWNDFKWFVRVGKMHFDRTTLFHEMSSATDLLWRDS